MAVSHCTALRACLAQFEWCSVTWHARALSLLHFATTFDYSPYFVDLQRLEYYEDMASEEPTPEELLEAEGDSMEPGLPSDPQTEEGPLDAAALLSERFHAIDSTACASTWRGRASSSGRTSRVFQEDARRELLLLSRTHFVLGNSPYTT